MRRMKSCRCSRSRTTCFAIGSSPCTTRHVWASTRRTPADDDATLERARAATAEYLAGQSEPGSAMRHLVIANDYPEPGREYGNGFVHRRIQHYRRAGVHVDVVLASPSTTDRIYEFDGVRVLSGRGPEISELLSRVTYDSVSVHFLNRMMWDYLEPHLADITLHVFLHGYECSSWIRRFQNLNGSGTLPRAGDQPTIDLQQLWHEVVTHPHAPASYIFVSDWFKGAVMDDMHVVFPPKRTHVIHNIVDTTLFYFQDKEPEQRFNLLWVRSAAQRNYAHDIAIETLKQLSESPLWSKAKVTIVGDGQYFGEFATQLGQFDNVTIRQGFIVQEEISRLHDEHGIFLVPSRLDSQGVSRDEAMSSGLVVATNLVTAIPEFVDEDSAIVAEPERADQLAQGILRVWEDPELFQRLAVAGAERARAQCGPEATVGREMALLGMPAPEGK